LQEKRKFKFLAISSLSASPAQKPYKRNAFSCVSGVHWRPFSGKHEKVKKHEISSNFMKFSLTPPF